MVELSDFNFLSFRYSFAVESTLTADLSPKIDFLFLLLFMIFTEVVCDLSRVVLWVRNTKSYQNRHAEGNRVPAVMGFGQ